MSDGLRKVSVDLRKVSDGLGNALYLKKLSSGLSKVKWSEGVGCSLEGSI